MSKKQSGAKGAKKSAPKSAAKSESKKVGPGRQVVRRNVGQHPESVDEQVAGTHRSPAPETAPER